MHLLQICSFMLPLLVASQTLAGTPSSYESGRSVFVEEMVHKHGLPRAEVAALMSDARYRQRIIDAMNRPYEAKPWRDYRALFVTPERVQGGVTFWRDNAALITRAEAAYGVPPQILVAILGIETNYGGNLGDHLVIDSLSTLGFSYPRRAQFFRGELEEFLLLVRDEGMSPRTAKGSYAGALGKPQFIPSSYRVYAVDFDGDGRRDLWNSNADVVGSIGNYLARHGWRRDRPIAAEAVLANGRTETLAITDKKPAAPETTLAQFAALGIEPAVEPANGRWNNDTRAALIELDGVTREYWLGFDNFYAITRYNHSNLYAMAVFQLGREIAQRYLAAGGG